MPDTSSTPSGLPVRVPQANLAEPLRGAEQAAEVEEEPDDPGRSPAEIQRIMGSYQRGAKRGRFDAARAERAGRTGAETGDTGTETAEGEADQ
ncbi:hypothetical protein [Actinomadura chibensis]|uniref:Uncharacterized protein n=1 Tax=Actinomadura chibensis TaxID=392828 RepID=A0A5D0NWS4_9ACTN|nr:hypothetical protein [Actinomadura chibensis]TYB48712.1 hypothetical protein FXF69_05940 [Actinomadura chibensis]